MYKFIFVTLTITLALTNASPGLVAPSVVTAQSSQYIARNYNTLATPLVAAAPLVAPAPLVKAAAPLPQYVAPAVASYATPGVPLNPYIASYAAAPYTVVSAYAAGGIAPYLAPAFV